MFEHDASADAWRRHKCALRWIGEEPTKCLSQASVWPTVPALKQCFPEGLRARNATVQDGQFVGSDTAVVCAETRTAPLWLGKPPEVLLTASGTLIFKVASISPIDIDSNLKYSLFWKIFTSPRSQIFEIVLIESNTEISSTASGTFARLAHQISTENNWILLCYGGLHPPC